MKAWTELLHQYSPALFAGVCAKAAAEKDQEVTLHLLKILKKLRASGKKKVAAFLEEQVEALPKYLKKLKLHRLDDRPVYFKDQVEKRAKTITAMVSSVLALSREREKDKDWRNRILERLTQPSTRLYVCHFRNESSSLGRVQDINPPLLLLPSALLFLPEAVP